MYGKKAYAPGTRTTPCLIVGKLTKENGEWYIKDEQTGAKFKIKPNAEQEKQFEKWLEDQKDPKNPCKDKPFSLPLCSSYGLKRGWNPAITKPNKDEDYPVISFPEQKGELPPPPVDSGGPGISTTTVVVTTTSVAAVALITSLIISHEGGNHPASVP